MCNLPFTWSIVDPYISTSMNVACTYAHAVPVLHDPTLTLTIGGLAIRLVGDGALNTQHGNMFLAITLNNCVWCE